MNSEKSGCLWSQEYFPGKRCICSRRGQAGQLDMEVCTQKKISATMIWFDLTKMIFEVQKRGKCDLLQWGRRDPGPHSNVDFLWRKATQREKKILMSLPQTILCRAQLPWQWGAEPYSGWWQAHQPFPHSKCRGRCLWLCPWFTTTTQPTCPTLIFA